MLSTTKTAPLSPNSFSSTVNLRSRVKLGSIAASSGPLSGPSWLLCRNSSSRIASDFKASESFNKPANLISFPSIDRILSSGSFSRALAKYSEPSGPNLVFHILMHRSRVKKGRTIATCIMPAGLRRVKRRSRSA